MTKAITVEGLGKSYLIRHKQARTYTTLRDVLSNRVRGILRRLPSSEAHQSASLPRSEWFWALKDVSFDLIQGQRLGIIGKNGAGKSTLLKILARITEPTAGRVLIDGRVASLLEVGTGFHPELTGRENIFLNGAILGMRKQEIRNRFDEIVDFSGVEKFLDTPVKRYSSGMYVRLAFAVAAHIEPEILIVDEVLAVGDMKFRQKCLGKMESLQESGRTLIFVSHDMSMVRHLCSEVMWLNEGNVFEYGKASDVTTLYERAQATNTDKAPTQVRSPSPPGYHLSRVELRNAQTGELSSVFKAGDTLRISLFAKEDSPADGFGVEFFLYNERGDLISFGGSTPVRNVSYSRFDREFTCELGPLPLTTGNYHFTFSVRPWGLERWDHWENAISFSIDRCDLYASGFDVPQGSGGNFMMAQKWSTG